MFDEVYGVVQSDVEAARLCRADQDHQKPQYYWKVSLLNRHGVE